MRHILPVALILILSSCDEQQFSTGDAKVNARFLLSPPTAMSGKISFDEAFLKLSHIQIAGTSATDNVTDLTHPIPIEEAPYRLTDVDSSHTHFSLPAFAYEQLHFNLYLVQDSYELVFSEPVQEAPSGDENPGDGQEAGNQDGHGNNDNPDGDEDDQGSDEDDRDDDDKGDQGDRDHDDHKDHKDDKKKNKGKDKDKGDKDNDEDDDDEDEDDDNDDDDGRIRSAGATVDLDHFFQNAKPAMVVFATYQNNGQTTNIIFALTGIDKLSIVAKQNDRFNIILGTENSAEISFNANEWFESLTLPELNAGLKQLYRGQQVLFIHKDYNVNIYSKLVSRLEASTEVNFIAQSDQ